MEEHAVKLRHGATLISASFYFTARTFAKIVPWDRFNEMEKITNFKTAKLHV